MSNIKKKVRQTDPFDILSNAPKITVAQLEKDKPAEIWAINILPNPSRLLIGVGTDGATTLTLENTWLPQQLSTMATLEQMLVSANFRAAVNGDPLRRKPPSIKIVSAEVAAQVLATAQAQVEADELASIREEVMSEQKKAYQQLGEEDKEVALKPNVKIVNLVSRLNSGNYSELAMTQMMKVQKDGLTDDDLKFIVQSSSKESIKKLAAKMLNRRTEGADGGVKAGMKKFKKKIKRSVS